jgi:TetR/AcrR family transcriptional regulator, tetracycline repressor protein
MAATNSAPAKQREAARAGKAGESERTRLSRSAVVDRALAIADSEGLDALTIRRLAQDLGVTPMALYWHFRSKDELIAGVSDRLWGEIRSDVDPAAGWLEQLRGMFESLIGVLRAHPSASQLLASSEKLGPSHWEVTEATLRILRHAGFDAWHASAIARNALWTALMLAMSEPGIGYGGTEQERAGNQWRKQVELASLPPERYPFLVEAAVPMTACDDPDSHYRFGVDLFLAGVEALAPSG